jgi:hypothetical protein
MDFCASANFRKRLGKRKHHLFYASRVAKLPEKNLLLMFTAVAETFPSPSLTFKSLETGEKRLLGTYAAGNTAYQAHKTILGQSGWVCTHTERGYPH